MENNVELPLRMQMQMTVARGSLLLELTKKQIIQKRITNIILKYSEVSFIALDF